MVAAKKKQLPPNIEKAIRRVLASRLKKFGFEDAEIAAGVDHDGDPVIFIDAHYRLTDEPVDPDATLATLMELRRKLIHDGEDRFPHLRHHFDAKQKVKGFA